MPSSALVAARLSPIRRRRGRYSRGGRGFAFPVPPVTFPASPLTARIQIALGADLSADWRSWNWLDITERVRTDLGVYIQRGRRDQNSLVTPSVALLKFGDTTGDLSRRKPTSPYYNLLTKNTPIWIQLNPGSGFVDRFHGYVNEWPRRWADPSGTDSFVLVRCGGVMRRLAQGNEVDDSIDRTILGDSPTYYWRIDDAAGSTSAASSMPNGGSPMVVSGPIVFGDLVGPPGGSDTAARMDSTAPNPLNVYAQNLNVAAPWTVVWSVLRPSNGSADGIAIFKADYFAAGTLTATTFTTTLDSSVSSRDWYHYMIQGTQVGSNWQVNWWRNGNFQGVANSGAGTLGAFDGVFAGNLNGLGGVSGLSLGYVGVYGHTNVDASTHSNALQAFNGELAHVRIARLCGERGIPVLAGAATSAAMGEQPAGKLLDLLRECEAADGGLLYEHEFGIGYLSLSERYNRPVALNLDFDSRHHMGMPEPSDDDQYTRNRWTVSRSGGLTGVTAEQTTGTMGTGPGGVGTWPDSATVNVAADSQLADQASWRVHMCTIDEDRWPGVPLKLHGTPDLIPGWLATRIGDRINLAHPPDQMTPDTIDAVVEGYTETFDQVTWGVGLNTSPYSPFAVGVLDDTSGRLDSGTSTLTADISSSATSFTVTTTNAADLWTTDAAEFPFDIEIWPGSATDTSGGEIITLSSITGASSPQTFNVSARSVNGVVKGHFAGAQVHVHRPLILAL